MLHGCSMAHFENKKTLEKPVFSRVFEEIKMRRKGLPGNTETHRNDVFSRLFEGFDRRNIPDNARCLLHICSMFQIKCTFWIALLARSWARLVTW